MRSWVFWRNRPGLKRLSREFRTVVTAMPELTLLRTEDGDKFLFHAVVRRKRLRRWLFGHQQDLMRVDEDHVGEVLCGLDEGKTVVAAAEVFYSLSAYNPVMYEPEVGRLRDIGPDGLEDLDEQKPRSLRRRVRDFRRLERTGAAYVSELELLTLLAQIRAARPDDEDE